MQRFGQEVSGFILNGMYRQNLTYKKRPRFDIFVTYLNLIFFGTVSEGVGQ